MRTTQDIINNNRNRFLWLVLVVVISLLVFQLASAEPPQPEDEPAGMGSVPPPEGGMPIVPVFVDQSADEQALESAADVNAPPIVQLWYGDSQSFGQIGTPQSLVDIVGRVTPANLASLQYTLNGSASRRLNIGSDGQRLYRNGDFHIEIDRGDLFQGPNLINIIARNQQGETTNKGVTVNYDPTNVWPTNYVADWSSSSNVLDIAQPVDGNWAVRNDKLQLNTTQDPLAVGYDRLIVMGETNWNDYEVTMPFKVRAIDPMGFGGVSSGAGFGVILRWTGYTQLSASEQPSRGWQHLGAIAWQRWWLDNNNRVVTGMHMIGDSVGSAGLRMIGENPLKRIEFGTNYMLKASVQSLAGETDIYRIKVWPQGTPEPPEWDIVAQGNSGEPEQGALGILAHNVDVEVGNVTVRPTSSINPTLLVNSSGDGQVTVSPAQTSYSYGQEVLVTAVPNAAGTVLGRWEGGASGRQNPLRIRLTADTTITGVFVPAQYGILAVEEAGGEGVVTVQPQAGASGYLIGEQITVSAIPPRGKRFDRWTVASAADGNDVADNTDNPYTFVFEGTSTVTARYLDLGRRSLEIITVGDGQVQRNPSGPYFLGDPVELTAVAGLGHTFSDWEGDASGSANPIWLLMNENKSVTANFEEVGERYTLDVTAGANGDVTVVPDQEEYLYNELVTLTALPDDGYMLANWSGDLNGNSNPVTFPIRDNYAIQANFAVARNPVSDDFNSCALNEERWSIEDPLGDSTIGVNGSHLRISLPAGQAHNLYNEDNTVPVAYTAADDEDFEVEVKMDSAVTKPYQNMGIIVRESDGRLIRFDVFFDGTDTRLYAATHLNNVTTQRINRIIPDGSPIYMRVSRTGSTWRQSYSYDGTNWTKASPSFSFSMNVAEIGLFAGNPGTTPTNPPAFTAEFDYFFNTARPIIPQSSNLNTISVSTVGNGSVAVNGAAQPEESYECGEVVTFRAIPQAGWNFNGWDGDLSGLANPTTLTVTGNHQVTGNFTNQPVTRYLFMPVVTRP